MKFYKLFKSKIPARKVKVVMPVSPPKKIPLKVFKEVNVINWNIRFIEPTANDTD